MRSMAAALVLVAAVPWRHCGKKASSGIPANLPSGGICMLEIDKSLTWRSSRTLRNPIGRRGGGSC